MRHHPGVKSGRMHRYKGTNRICRRRIRLPFDDFLYSPTIHPPVLRPPAFSMNMDTFGGSLLRGNGTLALNSLNNLYPFDLWQPFRSFYLRRSHSSDTYSRILFRGLFRVFDRTERSKEAISNHASFIRTKMQQCFTLFFTWWNSAEISSQIINNI